MQDTINHSDLEEPSAFKFWALQNPNAIWLVKTIIFQWRNASATVPGKAGKWIVYPRERWVEWSSLSLDQVKRALKRLEEDGLILRERHRFAGSEVRSFIQPTTLALKYLGRTADIKRLDNPKATSAPFSKAILKTPQIAPTSAPTSAPISAPISAPSDYTPFPSLPPVSPDLKGGSTPDKKVKGKGSQEGKKENAKSTYNQLMEEDEAAHEAWVADIQKKLAHLDPDEVAAQDAKEAKAADRLLKVKAITKDKKLSKDQMRTRLLSVLPRNPSAPASIWHPSDMYASGKGVTPWHTWSAEKLIEKQDQYDEYVANTKSKGGAKTSKWFV